MNLPPRDAATIGKLTRLYRPYETLKLSENILESFLKISQDLTTRTASISAAVPEICSFEVVTELLEASQNVRKNLQSPTKKMQKEPLQYMQQFLRYVA